MDRRLVQRVLISVGVAFGSLAVVSSRTPASAATRTATCRKPCTTTTTSAPTPTSTTSTTLAPPPTTTTSTTTPPTTSTTAAPTTTTTPPPSDVCKDGSTPVDATVTSEGARIRICTTVGNWSAAAVSSLLRANALDLDVVGPRLTIEVSTARPSSTGSSASCCDASGYYGFKATMSLNPSATSSFANAPDAVFAHEYGHAWTSYWLYMNAANDGQWNAYRNARWTTADGSQVLAQSSKLNSSYNWTDYEMAADDYRRLFGSPAAQAQLAYLNASVPDPQQVPGLGGFLLETWR